MKCPECQKEMRWVGDNEDSNENSYSFYECKECKIDLFKYWEEKEVIND